MRSSPASWSGELATRLRKPLAFLHKDFLSNASYKLAFIGQFFNIVFISLSYFFLARLFELSDSPHLERYGGDYFSFVLIGVACGSYLEIALRSFSQSIRDAQMLGTLEALLVTQTEIPTLILSASAYSFIVTSLRMFVFFLLGVLALGFQVEGANYFGALLMLGLTIVSFSSIGIISASFIMVFKRGDPFSWFFTNSSWLLGGVYFPISVLPDWLERVSYLLPITYSLEGMRLALLKGYSLGDLLPTALPLVVFALVMVPASLWIFQRAVVRAKADGTLTQY
ncbi:MAG: ABC transporter permease [Acidobacteriota bacterium]|nr:ABC transporter permease [Acidobacteriota bacterium]